MTDPRLTAARTAIARVLSGERGEAVETETLDCKEDPTRRGPRGQIQAGSKQDDDAARYFADEAACMANGEGGALIVGIDGKRAGEDALVGTDLERDWLRNRIRDLTEPKLTVGLRTVNESGKRLLIVLVPRNPGPEPHSALVSKRGRRISRRVGTNCHEMVGMAELMSWAQERSGYDWSAAPSGHQLGDARSAAVEALRDFLRESNEPDRIEMAELSDADLLQRLQLVRSGSMLNRAGELLCCPAESPGIVYINRPAPGAPSSNRVEATGKGLSEELRRVFDAIDLANRSIQVQNGGSLARGVVQALPRDTVREALLNAVMHREWDIPEPIVVDHTGDELVVFSPGELFGGVSIDTLLTAQSRTRNRLLGDVLRSLRLAEREGTGIDKMYVEMIRLGHARPGFEERDGGVRADLQGGDPVLEVLQAQNQIPRRLRETARMAVTIDLLRKSPSVTAAELAEAAQENEDALLGFIADAEKAGVLKRTQNPRPGGIRAWRLADGLREALGPVLPYYSRPAKESIQLIEGLAKRQGSVRNSDVQDLLGVTAGRASQLLSQAEREGFIALAPGAKRRGRGAHFIPA